jgi:hypothetical protein
MNTLVRIYCGRNLNNPNRQEELTREEFNEFLANNVVPFYKSFTVFEATGFYESKVENTFVIEILTDDIRYTFTNHDTAGFIAKIYANVYCQESVLVTTQEVKSTLYTTTDKHGKVLS